MLRRHVILLSALALLVLGAVETSKGGQTEENDSPTMTLLEPIHRRLSAQFISSAFKRLKQLTVVDVSKFVFKLVLVSILGELIARTALAGIRKADKQFNPKDSMTGIFNYTDTARVLPLGDLAFIQAKIDECFEDFKPLNISTLPAEYVRQYTQFTKDLNLVGINITADRVYALDQLAQLDIKPMNATNSEQTKNKV